MAAAFISSGKTVMPMLFALAALVSAEVIWQIISRRNKSLRSDVI
jgi:hypothetical protein